MAELQRMNGEEYLPHTTVLHDSCVIIMTSMTYEKITYLLLARSTCKFSSNDFQVVEVEDKVPNHWYPHSDASTFPIPSTMIT